MQSQHELCLDPRTIILTIGKKLCDREQLVGDAFHRGNDDDHAGILRDGLYEFTSVQHARGAEQRSSSKLERYDFLATTKQSGSFALKKFASSFRASRRARVTVREHGRD